MKLTPYIGVIDFKNYKQVQKAKRCIQPSSGRTLHVGAMMSYNSFHGIGTINGSEKNWLNQEGLQQLFVKDEEVFNVLHWTDDSLLPKTTAQDLITACKSCGPGLTGLQLDMVWPDFEMIMEVRNALPDLAVVLQVSDVAIKNIRYRNFSLEYMLCFYKSRIDGVLFDYGVVPFRKK